MRHAAIAGLLLAAAANAAAQPQAAPSFEVATIKPNKSGDDRAYSSILPGGRLSATNVSIRDLILSAYRFRFQPAQIIGGAGWITTEHFDIEAKAASGANPSESQIPDMLRGLLSDRFKLAVHEETREFPVYALVKNRGDGTLGPKLVPSSEADCVDPGPPPVRGPRPPVDSKGPQPCGRIIYVPSGWSARHVTTDQIAKTLEAFVGRVVVNRTGLADPFNVDLQFTRDVGAPSSPDAAIDPRTSIFTALREQLGLRLDSDKNTVSVLVIDHVERPTEN
jgi:uncharacterized protein (TIGR03435 family)